MLAFGEVPSSRSNEQDGLFDRGRDGPERDGEASSRHERTITTAPGDAVPVDAAETTYTVEELERFKEILESTGDYRVLRRSGAVRDFYPSSTGNGSLLRGVYLDVETTGLESADLIIELGLVVFEYDLRGRIYRVVDELDEFEDPGRPLPREIVQLTGIHDDQVKGKVIDDRRVAELVSGAHLVIAHNAAFDRPMVERRFPIFKELSWACSVSDVEWSRAGFRNRKLEYLAMRRGFFYASHRAISDCYAGVELLSAPLDSTSDETAMASLLTNSGRKGVRLWALGSPFESKDLLKSRRYRWNAEAKVWWRDIQADEHEAELDWLMSSVYSRRQALPYLEVDATVRYSNRLPTRPPRGAAIK